MKLNKKTLNKLKDCINNDDTQSHYRSGPDLVNFFNDLGFSDTYGKGFPARSSYTLEKLTLINDTDKMSQCLIKTFSVIDYVEDLEILDRRIDDINKYLIFDKYKIVRINENINIEKLEEISIEKKTIINSNGINFEEFFLRLEIKDDIAKDIKRRCFEIDACITNKAYLSAVIMIGGVLEGILLFTAKKYPQKFNKANCAPKNKEGVKKFNDWKLADLINVAYEVGAIELDIKKFTQVLRDFRNYIHPELQIEASFYPDEQTAIICKQLLISAVVQITNFSKK